MATTFYITAGLPAIDSANMGSHGGVTTFYMTAGLLAGDDVPFLSGRKARSFLLFFLNFRKRRGGK